MLLQSKIKEKKDMANESLQLNCVSIELIYSQYKGSSF